MRVIDAVLTEQRAESLEQRAQELGHRAVRLAGGDRVVLRITCDGGDPDEFLEEVREALRENCEDWEHYTAFEPLAIEPRPTDPEEEAVDEPIAGTDEIEGWVSDGARITRSFVVLSMLSGVLAAAGLLRGSVAVLVGAMVLAPLFQPIALAGVAIVLDDARRAFKAVIGLGVSLGLSLAAACLVTLLTPTPETTTLLELRAGISPFDLIIALAAGLAMAYIIIKRDSMSMVGIVVAASLMPVAAAIGITLAIWRLDLVTGAVFTLVSNVAGILLGLIVGLWIEQLRSTTEEKDEQRPRLLGRSVIATSVVVVLLAGIGIWSYASAKERDGQPSPSLDRVADRPVLLELGRVGEQRVYVVRDGGDAESSQAEAINEAFVIRADRVVIEHGSTSDSGK